MLAGEHPGSVDAEVVRALLGELGYAADAGECRGHIAYLGEKGYVRRDLRRAGGIEIELVAITAQGLDLLDGLIEDVGVDAGGRR